jgi:hypothetical protein
VNEPTCERITVLTHHFLIYSDFSGNYVRCSRCLFVPPDSRSVDGSAVGFSCDECRANSDSTETSLARLRGHIGYNVGNSIHHPEFVRAYATIFESSNFFGTKDPIEAIRHESVPERIRKYFAVHKDILEARKDDRQ